MSPALSLCAAVCRERWPQTIRFFLALSIYLSLSVASHFKHRRGYQNITIVVVCRIIYIYIAVYIILFSYHHNRCYERVTVVIGSVILMW